MYNRRGKTTRILKIISWFTLIIFSSQLLADPWVCSSDLNQDGTIDSITESLTCNAGSQGYVCPIEKTACVNSVCPLGNYQCVDAGRGPECSANTCYDLNTVDVETAEGPNGDMLQDDGEKNETGQCLDVTMVFSGRAMTCQPAGKSTAYQNCCINDSGEIYYDSTGASVEDHLTNKAIITTGQAAYAAYEAYSAAAEAGEAASAASEAGSAAASEVFATAFDPTSLAISIAVTLVMNYLTQACSAMSMETALLDNSGYCIYTGEYCKTRWSIGGCVQRERSFCCFNSKLARIIHEQGRPQLDSFNGFGDANNPDCRGFLPEEYQALDFTKMDFSEYYDDLRHAQQEVMQNRIQDTVGDFYEQTQQ